MCFHSQQNKSPQEVKKRFKISIAPDVEVKQDQINGFTFPKTPVIASDNTELIQGFQWGLIPEWTETDDIKKFTLNAKIETVHEKPSFKQVTHQKCLILSSGFYEWQWLNTSGSKKQKYLITHQEEALFAFAGIWSTWHHPQNGNQLYTYSMLTTTANDLMSKIHNTKKRMPIVVPRHQEQNWLHDMPIDEAANFEQLYQAIPIKTVQNQLNLF